MEQLDRDKSISTSMLSKQLGLDSRKVFELLRRGRWIQRDDDDTKWLLTAKGVFEGGEYVNSAKFGTYIVWPQKVLNSGLFKALEGKRLTSAALAKRLGLSSRQVNNLLAEQGWISHSLKGWELSDLGRVLGAQEREHETSGTSFVVWPSSILENPRLIMVVNSLLAEGVTDNHTRTGFVALDGHCLHNEAELKIDNWLYTVGLTHACGRLLPVGEQQFCDFYLPESHVYIEYWGVQNDPKALSRKMKKLELYRQHELKLIEIEDDDILHLDEILPKRLLKFDVQVY